MVLLRFFAALLMLSMQGRQAFAQAPSVRQLDMEAERVRSEYLDRLEKLASDYEESGEVAKAKETLRQILQIDPRSDSAQEKLTELDSLVFETKSVTVEVDVSRGWVSTNLLVQQNKPIRFEAEGSYRFISNITLGPDGLATDDLSRDVVSGIDCGKLIGLVVAPPKEPRKGQKARPGTPFAIGTQSQMKPETDGLLLLRLNIPGGTKSNGKLKVTIRGNIRSTSPTS